MIKLTIFFIKIGVISVIKKVKFYATKKTDLRPLKIMVVGVLASSKKWSIYINKKNKKKRVFFEPYLKHFFKLII